MAIECVLGERRLRAAIKLAGFGVILLFVIYGSFYHHDSSNVQRKLREDHEGAENVIARRRLLSDQVLDTEIPDSDNLPCQKIHEFNESMMCEFVQQVDSCRGDAGFLHYFEFLYCIMPISLVPLTMIMLFFWLLFLFVFLGTTAEEYFCPALTVMSQVLRLSQNVASFCSYGVTLLAFGNGAPDIFSALAAINQPHPQRASLAFGALFGAGMFVTTIVVGAVTITQPFMLTRRPFIRDIIFYIASVYWTFFMLWNNWISLWVAIGFILLYIFYVIVVVLGRVVFQKYKKKRFGTGDIPKPPQQPAGRELSASSPKTTPKSAPVGSSCGTELNGFVESTSRIGKGEDGPAATAVSQPRPAIVITRGEDDESNGDSVTVTTAAAATRHHQKLTGSIQASNEADHHDDHETRERCASRASAIVYGVSHDPSDDELEEYERGHHNRARLRATGGSQPRTRSPSPRRIRKTISGALDITEDVGIAVAGTPNLAKLWHHAYRKELVHEEERTHSPHQDIERHSPLTVRYDDTERAPLVGSPEPEVELRVKKPMHPFIKMLSGLWPFGETFRALRIWGKLYEIVKSPAGLMLSLTVPVIDHDEENDNWNRWLNILHCVTAPMFVAFAFNVGLIMLGGMVPVALLVFIASVMLAVLVACTSVNDKPPRYHCVFAWLGFAVAVIWIYSIANEIVNLLQVFGIVIDISDGILGITILAWGNSIGDAVANFTMARQGFPRMAIGACFGGPLLNMLLGIGIASTVKSLHEPSLGFELYFTQVQMVAALFLLISLSCSLTVITCLQFKMRRPYGVFLFCLYLVFIILAILAEVKVFEISIPGVLHPLD